MILHIFEYRQIMKIVQCSICMAAMPGAQFFRHNWLTR
ncbi:hypothetical protein X751_28390 [Mesorhizobium sp. LNJC395A00]|nr:hypothetical protein X751_28390 [Mesorhizobium sp. LNJC395A00]